MRRLLLIAACALLAGAAHAYPDRPITLVSPYSPGGADGFARTLANALAQQLGQPLALTNRDGGSGVVGMRSVAQSPPDGHTLAITPMTAIVVQPHLVRNLGIDPDSFAPVCGTNENILGVVVRTDSPIRDLTALVAEGKRRAMTFGSAGPNSLPQLGVFRIQRATGVDFTHVPYRGDPPHLNELLGGRLDFSSTVVASASELIESNRLRLIGVFSTEPHPDYPNVPTARQQGIDALQLSQVGIYAPRGTPVPILDQLEAACRAGLEDPAVRRVAATTRTVLNFMPRADFTTMIAQEFRNYERILRELGVEPQ